MLHKFVAASQAQSRSWKTYMKSVLPSPVAFFGANLLLFAIPPLSLWLGGFIGATTAAAVARAPAMHVALISFGIAALLFLVTEELLLEAHEAQEHSAHEEHIWWVDMFFFLGFLLSFLMDKLLDTD